MSAKAQGLREFDSLLQCHAEDIAILWHTSELSNRLQWCAVDLDRREIRRTSTTSEPEDATFLVLDWSWSRGGFVSPMLGVLDRRGIARG